MIDKDGLSTLNYHNGSDEFAEGTEEYYQNRLIKDYITLLTDPRTQHILHRSIDNDTKLLKDVLAEIEHGTNQLEMPYGFYSLSTQTERKDDYITGKIGIGPFALNNNSHILTMLYGVKFREFSDSIMTELGLTDLSGHLDKDGNSIMSWLSALINAHVDIAKDPYISRLNVGPFTYNLVNTLIRTGLGAKTFYFTTQPIMKELAKAYDQAGSSYMADQYKSKYQLQKDAVEKIGKDRFGNLKIDNWSFDELVKGVTDPKDVKIKPVINNYIRQIFDECILKDNANRNYNQIDGAELLPTRTTVDGEGKVDKIHFTPMLVQMLMYLAYLQFDPYATSVSNLVKYSKIDTKKHGKSYIEQQVYLRGFKKLFDNLDGGGLFEPEGLERLSKQSYIELKTINAISMTKNILKGQFLQATNAFDNAIQHVLNMIGKPDSLNVDLWNEISRAINASIKSEFINIYAGALRPGNDTYIHDLVSESEQTFEYTQSANSNVIKLAGTPKYDLKSYMHKKAHVKFNHNNKEYEFDYTIIGYDDAKNELIVDVPRKVHNNGKVTISGGENTIYDRFNRLAIELRDDPQYRDILDAAGEPRNMLLRSLVTGKTFDYKPMPFTLNYQVKEGADTYETLKFIKLFNALDQNGVESNFIIDAWDELLHDDNHPKLKEFAEDLVVYAFVTSGDQGGFTKFFKQVPFSWRKESGYADFIGRKLVEFQSKDIETEQLQDAILNNWHNSMLVPKYELLDGENKPNFMAFSGESKGNNYLAKYSYPTIMAALRDENGKLTVTIDPDNAPVFIKIPRRTDKDARDSQRRVTVYKRVSLGMRESIEPTDINPDGTVKYTKKWVHYPIYVKVEPKGNLLKGNFLMTEYGREDSQNKEYGPNEDGMKKMFTLGDFIEQNVVDEYKENWGQIFGQMIEDMNYQYLYSERFAGNEEAFIKALNNKNKPIEKPQSNSFDHTVAPSINNLIGREVYIGVKDNDGFHKDELFGDVISISEDSAGYVIKVDIDDKEYSIGLTKDFEIRNKNSKFYEMDIDGFSLKQVVDGEAGDLLDSKLRQLDIKHAGSKHYMPISKGNTAQYGVQIDPDLIKNYQTWLKNNPNGIVAYRVNKQTFNTPEAVEQGIIGNPFDWLKYGAQRATKMFYRWIVNNENFEEPLATDEFKEAIVKKLKSSPKNTPILYYKELGYPSHATVMGWIIQELNNMKQSENKEGLSQEQTDELKKEVNKPVLERIFNTSVYRSKNILPSIILNELPGSLKPYFIESTTLIINSDSVSSALQDKLLKDIINIHHLLFEGNLEDKITVASSDWNELLNSDVQITGFSSFKEFVKDLLEMIDDADFSLIPYEKYNDQKTEVTIGKTVYDVIKYVHDNPDAISLLFNISISDSLFDIISNTSFNPDKYNNLSQLIIDVVSHSFKDGFMENVIDDDYTVQDALENAGISMRMNQDDIRQLELFDGAEYSRIEALMKEAEEIKKQCKGK